MCPPTSFDAVTTPRALSLLAHRVGRGITLRQLLRERQPQPGTGRSGPADQYRRFATVHYSAAAWGWIRTSHVQSVHLSYWVASTGRSTGRDDAVDFRKILGREQNVRGAHIFLKVLARFRAGYRDDEDSGTL